MSESLESVAENQPSGAISKAVVDLWHHAPPLAVFKASLEGVLDDIL